ncbi:uncharacterized protein SOCEGT47_062450 [Sorangium cellulosum]|uniref:ABC transmembrane type-1 domain-containing protein n=1 Tax=Sorangium cellulosum TaxID=56 RepID=A0A4P2Q8Z7_SORCE|nr:extracellular solute-binding protein [Sorangium cellulosum]AUX25696.1 uncharacterized protein SOCEGT47_062450 [Sorangium cellulosum]
MTSRTLEAVAAFALLAVGAAACSKRGDDKASSSPSPSASPASAPATLTYWASNQAPSIEDDKKILQPELDKFEKQTGIKVKLEVIPWSDLLNRILGATTSGAGPLTALFRVVLPAARPGVVAVAIYAFMTAWGEVLFASVLTSEDGRTLAVGLQGYATQSNIYWNQVMAASVVVSVPVVTGFLLLQRYLVQGLTAGAVKS